MSRIALLRLAHGRSGDKGDTVNVGIAARRREDYPILVAQVTAERVAAHFGAMVRGPIERFELPNLAALNFLLHGSLDGGGTVSLMTDALGKTFAAALLRMEVDVPDPSDRVLFESQDGIAILTLNRPARRNALDDALVAGLRAALERAAADATVGVILLRAAGPDFCAGADLDQTRSNVAHEDTLDNLADAARLGELFIAMRRLGKPIIGVVHGRALAGGAGVATACDLVILAESAELGYPEVHLGLVPAMVGALLRRLVGEKVAFELLAGGGRVTATEAQRLGLANRVLPDADLADGALAIARDFARRSHTALRLTKRLLYGLDCLGFEDAIGRGAEINVLARLTRDGRDGVRRFLDRHGG